MYPEIEFPVSRTTPSISNNIKWYHDKTWPLICTTKIKSDHAGERLYKCQIKHHNWSFLSGHNIDGYKHKNIFTMLIILK